MGSTALLKLSNFVVVDVDDDASGEQAIADGADLLGAAFDRVLDLHPAGARVLAYLGQDQFGNRLVVELGSVLDLEAFAVRPQQVQRRAVLRASPSGLLEEEAR